MDRCRRMRTDPDQPGRDDLDDRVHIARCPGRRPDRGHEVTHGIHELVGARRAARADQPVEGGIRRQRPDRSVDRRQRLLQQRLVERRHAAFAQPVGQAAPHAGRIGQLTELAEDDRLVGVQREVQSTVADVAHSAQVLETGARIAEAQPEPRILGQAQSVGECPLLEVLRPVSVLHRERRRRADPARRVGVLVVVDDERPARPATVRVREHVLDERRRRRRACRRAGSRAPRRSHRAGAAAARSPLVRRDQALVGHLVPGGPPELHAVLLG